MMHSTGRQLLTTSCVDCNYMVMFRWPGSFRVSTPYNKNSNGSICLVILKELPSAASIISKVGRSSASSTKAQVCNAVIHMFKEVALHVVSLACGTDLFHACAMSFRCDYLSVRCSPPYRRTNQKTKWKLWLKIWWRIMTSQSAMPVQERQGTRQGPPSSFSFWQWRWRLYEILFPSYVRISRIPLDVIHVCCIPQ